MFQSTHSLRSATIGFNAFGRYDMVSIHALLAECDKYQTMPLSMTFQFQSTHSLRSATQIVPHGTFKPRFQSTHSLRSATIAPIAPAIPPQRFNPRTPCGVRQLSCGVKTVRREFQSTHSLRSATLCLFVKAVRWTVSIHALLAECDSINELRISGCQ